MMMYNRKIIDTPTYREIYDYEDTIRAKKTAENKENEEKKPRVKFEDKSTLEQVNNLIRMKEHYYKQRWEISRLVDCNFDNNTKFMTLTFAENIQDVGFTNTEFTNFIRRLNYYVYKTKKAKLKYLATWERQKRGAIHYHVIFFGLPYIKKPELRRLWGHGFIRVNKTDVDSADNRGRYVSKYFGKDLDTKDPKKKAFFKSQNLKSPEIQKLMTDEIISRRENQIIFEKDFKRKVYMGFDEIEQKQVWSESKVHYTKIKK